MTPIFSPFFPYMSDTGKSIYQMRSSFLSFIAHFFCEAGGLTICVCVEGRLLEDVFKAVHT